MSWLSPDFSGALHVVNRATLAYKRECPVGLGQSWVTTYIYMLLLAGGSFKNPVENQVGEVCFLSSTVSQA
jgi:hypothetical protein